MKLQTKLKWIRGIRLFLIIISILTLVNIITDYDDINNQYVQRKLLFETLEQLHQDTLDDYGIDYSDNKRLELLSRSVDFQKRMIVSSEPNNEVVSYYYYILTLGALIMIYVIQYLNKKEEELQGFPVDVDEDE